MSDPPLEKFFLLLQLHSFSVCYSCYRFSDLAAWDFVTACDCELGIPGLSRELVNTGSF